MPGRKILGIIGLGDIGKKVARSGFIEHGPGAIIDDTVLYKALKEKRIKGAALDVFTHDPSVGNPLLKLDNVIFSSHLGGNTIITRNRGIVS